MTFEELGLSDKILSSIKACKYDTPTPIQESIIPHILKNKDVQAIAPTGSGKTAAFVLPIVNNLNKNFVDDYRTPKALILVPTRELAVQIQKSVEKYSFDTELESVLIYGGTKMAPQVRKLEKNVDIIVATPGRLAEHIKNKDVDFSKIKTLVLDEADTMLDMGFVNEINVIFEAMAHEKQILLFSATLGQSIKKLADKVLKSQVCVNIDKDQKQTHKINQYVYYVSKEEKKDLLSYLIGKDYKQQFIVFTRMKHTAEEVYKFLEKSGLSCVSLHGDKTHGSRLKAIEMFRNKEARVMVATDITSRGIDIQGLEFIFNYDIPNAVDDYIHRIGRTGRAGQKGNAISFVSPSEVYSAKVIQNKLNFKFTEKSEDGYGAGISDDIKSPKIIVRKDEKRKVQGAFGNKKKKEPKQKKYVSKRDTRYTKEV